MDDDPDYETYRDEEGKTRVRRRDQTEVCDFCLSPEPRWEYPAAFMEIVGHPLITHSDSDWGACDECYRLIEAHNIGGLVERIVRYQPENAPPIPGQAEYPPLSLFRRVARRNVLRFVDARTGPPRPYRPDE